jgi:electron transfer flavoprotein beta subunit
MQIVVCLKQIAYAYARTGKDPERNFLAPEDTITCVNQHDEAALELALRVKDAVDETRVTLLTLGPLRAESELRRCLAMGADRLCRIDFEDEMDPWAKARVMAPFIREMRADLIFCGKESLDRRSGQVGAFLARELGLPFVSAVSGLMPGKDSREMRAERSAGRGIREIIACPLPALFTVEWGSADPRYPAYPDKIKARSLPIEVLIWEGEKPPSRLIQKRVFPPRPRPKKIPAPDSRLGALERIRQLLAGSRMEKKGQLLTGTPESQVKAIFSFLQDHDFLRRINPKQDKKEDGH